ncbi:hypothetical protein SAMN05216406_13336 [Nitrosomonas ureae]|uniref:Uncharacterized protein n=1 Tax=Nitrosomonas ureae TaxID=44577 RepID=A0A1H2GKU6_9PROT|nr:hypothetical protein SAMN05216406_13336 [Nitrosomonas ureae]
MQNYQFTLRYLHDNQYFSLILSAKNGETISLLNELITSYAIGKNEIRNEVYARILFELLRNIHIPALPIPSDLSR